MRPFRILSILLSLIVAYLAATSCDLAENELEDLNNIISSTVTENEKEEEEKKETEEDNNTEGEDDRDPIPGEFVILFTNDFHSQIEPMDNGRGGVLRMKALVDSVRTVEPVVLLADAGDLVQGTYYFSLFNGVVEMQMLDILGYDIRTLGNHEFDKKMTGLGEMFALSKVPVVASNYDFSATSLAQYVLPSKILDAGTLKVGFIGLNVRLLNLVDPAACEGVVWQDAINVADMYAAELRNQGADIVIALSHLGYEANSDIYYYDRGIVKNTKHIDMIIGGHSHTRLYSPDYVTDLDGDKVPIVQTGSNGVNLGYAKIKMNEDGKPSFEYRLIPVNNRLDNRIDPTFSDIIDSYAAEVEEKMSEVLGYSPYEINKYGSPQSRLGNLSADGLVWMAQEYAGIKADVGICNSGGIRAVINKGDVTLGDVYAVYPFDNVLSIVNLKGRYLKEVFNAVASGGLPVGGDIQLVLNGTTVTSATVNGEAIDDNKTYTIATLDYLANLGRYGLENATDRRDGTEFVRDMYGEYFKFLASQNNGNIYGPLDDRIISE